MRVYRRRRRAALTFLVMEGNALMGSILGVR
jgi:hypothetical protein